VVLSAGTAVSAGTAAASTGRAHATAAAPRRAAGGAIWLGQRRARVADTVYRGQPASVPGVPNVVGLAATDATAYALRADGTVWAWGRAPSASSAPAPRRQRDGGPRRRAGHVGRPGGPGGPGGLTG